MSDDQMTPLSVNTIRTLAMDAVQQACFNSLRLAPGLLVRLP